MAFSGYSAFSQRPLQVSYDRNTNGDYVFFAQNTTNKVYHIVVDIPRMSGVKCGCQFPYSANAKFGKTQLFKLTKEGALSNPDFSWSWSYNEGYANPKINEEVVYALPIAPGNQTVVIGLQNIRNTFGDKPSPQDYYAVGFSLSAGDTVFASRGGVVQEIKKSSGTDKDGVNFSRDRNMVKIRHKDNTLGNYSIFKSNSFLVEEGQLVEAGTPLGLAGGENYTAGPHVRMWIQYLSYKRNLPKEERYRWNYLKPKFATANDGTRVVASNLRYEGLLTEDLIVQEMTKREIKRRAKKKKENQER